MIEVSLKAIGPHGGELAVSYGTNTTRAAAVADAWRGMAARFAAYPKLEAACRDLKLVVL